MDCKGSKCYSLDNRKPPPAAHTGKINHSAEFVSSNVTQKVLSVNTDQLLSGPYTRKITNFSKFAFSTIIPRVFSDTLNHKNHTSKKLYMTSGGRLGNIIFQFTGLYGLLRPGANKSVTWR